MRIHMFCVLLFLLSACTKNTDRISFLQSSTQVGPSDSLQAYAAFLLSLDSTKSASFPLAADRLVRSFKGAPATVADSAFFLLEAFQWRCANAIQMPEDIRTDMADQQSHDQYDSMLRKDGFKLWWGEGEVFIDLAPEPIYRRLYGLFTAPVQAYMRQQVEEQKEQLEYDLCLAIPPSQLVDWIIWAERFEKRYPKFKRISDVNRGRRFYLKILLHGMSNTPSLDSVFHEQDSSVHCCALAPPFKEGYLHLLQAYPTSRTATLLRPYIEALQREDYSKAMRLRDDLEDQLQ